MSTDRSEPVAILWDIENCGVPQGVNAEDVSLNLRMALRFQLAVRGPLTVLSAYGDISRLPLRTRQGFHKTGVDLIDIPHGTKDAADKAILVDMFLFAVDNPPPCTLVLITGDVDFAPALHKLGQRGYLVVLAIPSGRKVSPALLKACHHLLSWPDIARGKYGHPMHDELPQLLHQEKDTWTSLIKNPKKTVTAWAGILGNKLSEAVGIIGEKSATFSRSAIKDNQLSMTITPNADKFCMDQVQGNDHYKDYCSDEVGDNPNFGKLEMGPCAIERPAIMSHGIDGRIGCSNFVPWDGEHVSNLYAIPNPGGLTGALGVQKEGCEHRWTGPEYEHHFEGMRRTAGVGHLCRIGHMPVQCECGLPSSGSSSCPPASYGEIGNENAPHVTSQGMDGRIGSSNFKPSGGEYVCNQFVIPNCSGLTGPFGVQKTARKQAARAKGKGQRPSLQLKVKRKKKNKAKRAATRKRTEMRRKSARLSAIHA